MGTTSFGQHTEIDEPRMLGRFELTHLLGEGGFGRVFAAVDPHTRERVALKELVRATPAALARFKQEFRALADLHDPHLVGIRELFEHEGRWVIAMELVEGCHLLEFVAQGRHADNDNEPCFDAGRLRCAFAGVTRGLIALHEHGVLHRDLKPSNVRVTPDGRAVLLDFGLLTQAAREAPSTQAVVGTAAYMAPEQALGAVVGPPADFYAMGVCLFEALTGRLPFEAPAPIQMLLRKQHERAPLASSLAGSFVPADLDALCARLLSSSAEERPDAREILRALAPGDATMETHAEPQASFAGREAELTALERNAERCEEGELRIVLVEGESGVGKSALVEEFVRQERARNADTLVLRGRCYENEQVPYKAFDGCMDVLVQALKKLSRAQCKALLPKGAPLIAQMFPVMRELKALAETRADDVSSDPTARRLEAFSALSSLLANLAAERPVVLVVDDLQWADAESFRMMRALVEAERRPALLLLCTVRPRTELEPNAAENIEGVRAWACTDVLPLHGLPRPQARELAKALLGPGMRDEWLGSIAEESKGHPLFISELVRYVVSHDIGATGSVTLDAALATRIQALGRDARTLLELVALSGRPMPSHLLARALASSSGLGELTKLLLAQRLVRRRKSDQLVCYHDRIRHVVEGLVPRTALPRLHASLAAALAEARVDPSEQARHWDKAGERDKAFTAYVRAGDEALDTLAFVRAEQLYARALTMRSEPRDEVWRELVIKRAHASARAGRSAEAARAYQTAAEGAVGPVRGQLRIWATQHLLQSAQLDDGLRSARDLLSELGTPLPKSLPRALATLAWERGRVSMMGTELRGPAPEGVRDEQKLALDALGQLSFPISWVDLVGGLPLNSRYLRRALATGDTRHAARALGQEAVAHALQKPADRSGCEALFARAAALVEAHADPAFDAYQLVMRGSASLFHWDLISARQLLQDATTLLETRCTGEPWLLTNARMSLTTVLFQSGEHAAYARRSERWLADAREREDRFAVTALSTIGQATHRFLMRDDPEGAETALAHAIQPWPEEPFSLAHLGALLSTCWRELYRGGPSLHRWLENQRARLRRAFLMKTGFSVGLLRQMQLRALLAHFASAAREERGDLLRRARKRIADLRSLGTPSSEPMADLMTAQLALAEDRPEEAALHARRAEKAFAIHGAWEREAANYLAAYAEQGAARTQAHAALERLAEQGWRNPERALYMHLPVLHLLAPPRAPGEKRRSRRMHERYELRDTDSRRPTCRGVDALDVRTNERVRLKELVGVDVGSLARFKEQFRALQGIHHRTLARLDTLFEHEGAWFIAMEHIDGEGLVSWVRHGDVCDVRRVRHGFGELAEGLATLHDAGFVHGDLRTEHVHVSPSGRVVLSDFGALARIDESTIGSAALSLSAYSAPELSDGREIGAAADAYAFGVCLYEALTGRLPKQRLDPALGRSAVPSLERPSHVASDVPADLDALCVALLEGEPEKRPPLWDVARALLPVESSRAHSLPVPRRTIFAGRTAELSRIEDALATPALQGLRTIVMEGESGVGKTALLDEVIRRFRASHEHALALRSTCYENEQIPYRAFDAAIDALARALRKLPSAERAALLPAKAAALPQLFPVLGSVDAIARATKRGLAADPAARRIDAFGALRALLGNLAATRPLLIAIDDLHWADAESHRLFAALAEAPAPLRFCVVATARPATALEAPEPIEHIRSRAGNVVIQLLPLDAAQTAELTRTLLGGSASDAFLQAVAAESRGQPLLVEELVLNAGPTLVASELSLDAVLAKRLRGLDPTSRSLLELVALATRPYGAHLFARALGATEPVTQACSTLCSARLLRVRDQELACFHDSIRQRVCARVEPARARELHAMLASALDADPTADPADRARHWDAAGVPDRALPAYVQAADAALEGLGFARAEALFARAIELHGPSRDELWLTLVGRRADALGRSGRSAEAAREYAAAAEHGQGERRLRMRLAAAQHLLQSAQVEAGMQVARELLDELGLPLPPNLPRGLGRLLWEGTRLGMRGLHVSRRSTPVPERDRLALDALEQLSFPIGWVDLLGGATLNPRHLRRALDSGETRRVARALGHEAVARVVRNPKDARVNALLERCEKLAAESADPAIIGHAELMLGTAALFRFDLATARSRLTNAESILHGECGAEPWLLTNTRMTLGMVLFFRGEHASAASLAEQWLTEAAARADQFAVTAITLNGYGSMRWLMRDDVEAAERAVEQAIAPWPDSPYTIAHLGSIWATTSAKAYTSWLTAEGWLDAHAERHRDAFLLRTPWARSAILPVSVSVGLATLMQTPPSEREAMARRTGRCIDELARIESDVALALSELLRAQLCWVQGNAEHALEHARAARTTFASQGCVYSHAAEYLEGAISGGSSGREQRDHVVRELAQQGWEHPARALSVLGLPIVDSL